MKLVSSFALATALVLGVGAGGTAAQAKKAEEPKAAKATYSEAEQKALLPLQTAVTAKNWDAAKAALPAAQAASQGADARYALGRMEIDVGFGANDDSLKAQGVDLMIDSGKLSPVDLPKFYQNQAVFATNAKNYPKAETAFGKMLELNPNDSTTIVSLAQLKLQQKKNGEALPLIERAIQIKEAAGQKPEEILYKYALQLNIDAKNGPRSVALSRQLLGAYPTAENWKTALMIYQRSATLDSPAQLDLLRLMRASKSFTQAGEYLDLAERLDTAGLPGEAKSVLDEGVASGKLATSQPGYVELIRTVGPRSQGDRASLDKEQARALAGPSGSLTLKLADAYAGYGDYTKAVPLYRASLQKGGVDANVVNTRLGIALASSGDRAGATEAFKAVTGPRADLAGLWIAYLNRGA